MNYGLNGLNPLSYVGVNSVSPAQTVIKNTDPDANDWQNQQVGNWWFNPGTSNSPLNNVFVLTNLQRNVATWTKITATGGSLLQLTGDTGTATPVANSIQIAGGTNINTSATGAVLTVNLDSSISLAGTLTLPNTVSSSVGMIFFGGASFIHNFGGGGASGNTFIGGASGNVSLTTASNNQGFGPSTLQGLTIGDNNNAFGSGALFSDTTGTNNNAFGLNSQRLVDTGNNNCSFGGTSLAALVTGSNNCAFGNTAGNNYTGAESSNIVINNQGVVGESNVMRIGAATGAGVQELSKTFIAGIRGVTTDVNDAVAVLIDSAGQLGTVSSSIRYKENVQDIGDSSNILYQLKPVSFDYINRKSDYKHVGLIAEEVEKVAPELVVYKDSQPETVKYHDLIPLMLNELIKLNKRIAELENMH